MEPPSDSRNNARNRIASGAAETSSDPRTRHGTKLRDVLMTDKPNLSYADFHHELTRNPGSALPKYASSQHSQVLERRNLKEEELVKYMSNLPSYLEKGKNYQEKALNVGVLDWRHLEKWRYSQKQMPPKHNGYSPSSSNTSLFSTDGSSTHSSKGQNFSPGRQRFPRASLHSPVEASPKGRTHHSKSSSARSLSFSHGNVPQSRPQKVFAGGGMTPEIEVFGEHTHKFRDSSSVGTGKLLTKPHKAFGPATICERTGFDLKSVSETRKKLIPDKYEVAATCQGKKKIQDSESSKEIGSAADQGYSDRGKSGIVIMSRDPLKHSRSSFTGSATFTANDRLSVEQGEKFLLPINNSEGRLPTEAPPVPSFSSRMFSSPSRNRHTQENKTSSETRRETVAKPSEELDTKMKFLLPRNNLEGRHPTEAPRVPSFPSRMFSSPSRNRHTQENKPTSEMRRETVAKPSEELDTKMKFLLPRNNLEGRHPTEAPRVPSFPSRMFSSPSRNRHTQESKLTSEARRETATKPSEELDARKASERITKARNPSPIRRLSNAMGKMIKNAGSRENSPLRRSSANDCIPKSGPYIADSSLFTDNPCGNKLSTLNNRGRSSPLRRLFDPLLKPRVSNCSEPTDKHSSSAVGTMKSSNKPVVSHAEHSDEVKLRSSSTLQALLQVSLKNGVPLFTFAIDSESNILAATVRKSSAPGKGRHIWIYTFFAIREVNKKSGSWLNSRGKGGNNGYVPNVVAQMKVSDSCSSCYNKQENSDNLVSREFDLFAVDVGQGDEYSADFHPTNEFAAIIVKLPKLATENTSKDDNSSFDWLDSSLGSLRENSQVNLSTTVVLPGGLHAVPSKGEISRLAQRWRSGGLCDCGGWDLGCQLRVYSNKNKHESKSDSSRIGHIEDKLQLFSQVGQDNEPVLSLAPFKERIYSVEFSSSFSLLQAFAVSVSFIDCRRPPEFFEPNNAPEKVTTEVTAFGVPIRSKMSSTQAEAPGRYVSYPPHSPAGRV